MLLVVATTDLVAPAASQGQNTQPRSIDSADPVGKSAGRRPVPRVEFGS